MGTRSAPSDRVREVASWSLEDFIIAQRPQPNWREKLSRAFRPLIATVSGCAIPIVPALLRCDRSGTAVRRIANSWFRVDAAPPARLCARTRCGSARETISTTPRRPSLGPSGDASNSSIAQRSPGGVRSHASLAIRERRSSTGQRISGCVVIRRDQTAWRAGDVGSDLSTGIDKTSPSRSTAVRAEPKVQFHIGGVP